MPLNGACEGSLAVQCKFPHVGKKWEWVLRVQLRSGLVLYPMLSETLDLLIWDLTKDIGADYEKAILLTGKQRKSLVELLAGRPWREARAVLTKDEKPLLTESLLLKCVHKMHARKDPGSDKSQRVSLTTTLYTQGR